MSPPPAAIGQFAGVRWLVDVLGLGVSASAVLLIGVALYLHRAASVAGTATGAASTGATTLKLTALILAGFVGLGIFSIDWSRAGEVSHQATTWATEVVPRLIGRVI